MTKIVFMGTPDFSVPVLRRIVEEGYEVAGVVTQPDRPVGRKKTLTAPPVKEEAIRLGLPVFQPKKIREPEEVAKIAELAPDLIITAAFGQILPKALLDIPQYGCINVHASLLPELRGGAPIHYAIMEGKEKTGITIMYMAEKLDAGDIISQQAINIEESDDVGTLHEKLSRIGSDLLAETLPPLLGGKIEAVPQDDALATYAPNIPRELEKIDWTKPGGQIFNHVRGLCPWPVAYTLWEGKPLKIWKAEKTVLPAGQAPGTVAAIEEDGFTVASGDGTGLKITELQPAGKKKMPAEQFLRGAGANLKIGDVLGNE